MVRTLKFMAQKTKSTNKSTKSLHRRPEDSGVVGSLEDEPTEQVDSVDQPRSMGMKRRGRTRANDEGEVWIWGR